MPRGSTRVRRTRRLGRRFMSTLLGYAMVEAVIDTVCKANALTETQLLSKPRPEHLAWPRQIAMTLAHWLSDLTQPEIAVRFRRDHQTVRWAVRRVRDRVETSPKDAAQVNELTERIKQWQNQLCQTSTCRTTNDPTANARRIQRQSPRWKKAGRGTGSNTPTEKRGNKRS